MSFRRGTDIEWMTQLGVGVLRPVKPVRLLRDVDMGESARR